METIDNSASVPNSDIEYRGRVDKVICTLDLGTIYSNSRWYGSCPGLFVPSTESPLPTGYKLREFHSFLDPVPLWGQIPVPIGIYVGHAARILSL
jgi:hypothetical protein